MPDLDDATLRELHRRRRAGDTPDVLAEAYGFASAREVFLLLRQKLPPRQRVADERARAMVAAREQGQTMAAIGQQWGLTRERVRQIVTAVSGTTPAQDRAARIRAVPVEDDAVVAALQALSRTLAAEQGAAAPVHVSLRQWDARRDPELLPSGARVAARYRSWDLACAAAGLPRSDRPATPGTPRRWTDQELRIWVARFLLGATGPTTTGEYDLWAGQHRDAPGLQTVVLRLGGWGAAKTSSLGRTGPGAAVSR